jgi:hypothetical protein
MEARFDTMERKGIAVVTAEQVEQGLKRGSQATALEERALRMRYGARVNPEAPLPQVAEPESELADELLLIEMRLLAAIKRRNAEAKQQQAPGPASKASAASKAKIVAGLKKKG